MNIKEAKTQILNAIKAYLTKDAYGNHIIPIERQRPLFLMGPPGVGKTAIMEQVASELGIGLVSYSMTHHTRQSALGLPFIQKKNYGGIEYDVSEYTMSEIIASVYDMMETTGICEGILFLDEINCVSETLAPSMLQFLQYKIFGRHRVPNGWIVVTAGNPPEYNNSVREFDIVTWDRLKRVDVEADYQAWKEYAYSKQTHAAILSYLDIKKDDFYKIETTVEGKSFVTARGWSDLSDMMKLYEMHGLTIDEKLIGQYLQNKRIAKDFAVYYDLFNKYKSDYQIHAILNGKATEEIKQRAKNARYDERLALLGLLIDGIANDIHDIYETRGIVKNMRDIIPLINRSWMMKNTTDFATAIYLQIEDQKNKLEKGKLASSISADQIAVHYKTISELEKMIAALTKKNPANKKAATVFLQENHLELMDKLKKSAEQTGKKFSNLFQFCEEVFSRGSQEMLILVTELTVNPYSTNYIANYHPKEYFEHNKDLLFYNRQREITQELENLDLSPLED